MQGAPDVRDAAAVIDAVDTTTTADVTDAASPSDVQEDNAAPSDVLVAVDVNTMPDVQNVTDVGVIGDAASGCTTNAECATDQFCAGMGCDTPGTCSRRPGGCPQNYNPVCGCDNHTYGNSCSASSAGVRISHTGECDLCATVRCSSGFTCCPSTGMCVADSCGSCCLP